MQRAYIAPQKAYIAKRDTHTAAYSVTRVSRACNARQKAAIAVWHGRLMFSVGLMRLPTKAEEAEAHG